MLPPSTRTSGACWFILIDLTIILSGILTVDLIIGAVDISTGIGIGGGGSIACYVVDRSWR
ncbi:hypothetical protein RRF57_008098 [Xylaria bambusicola]|uniref:Uncharacterized protein n=1 Tax=Xylaria bambusicola TaxID=326684 RepID=A0AAN7UWG5_9PEZI